MSIRNFSFYVIAVVIIILNNTSWCHNTSNPPSLFSVVIPFCPNDALTFFHANEIRNKLNQCFGHIVYFTFWNVGCNRTVSKSITLSVEFKASHQKLLNNTLLGFAFALLKRSGRYVHKLHGDLNWLTRSHQNPITWHHRCENRFNEIFVPFDFALWCECNSSLSRLYFDFERRELSSEHTNKEVSQWLFS